MATKISAGFVSNYINYIETRYGKDKMREIISRLTPEEQQTFLFPVFGIRWFDVHFWQHLQEKSEECIPSKKGWLVEEIMADTAKKDLSGRYKHFLPFVTPLFVMKRVSKVFSLYTDVGTLTAESPKKNLMVIKLVGLPHPVPWHYRTTAGYFYGIAELMKMKNVKIPHTACVLNGQPYCQWDMTWTK